MEGIRQSVDASLTRQLSQRISHRIVSASVRTLEATAALEYDRAWARMLRKHDIKRVRCHGVDSIHRFQEH